MDENAVAWIVVVIAGLLEPSWLYFLEKSEHFKKIKESVLTIVLLFMSILLMSFSMKTIGPGTTYAVWTGIGVVGAVAVGYAFFEEKMSWAKMFFVILIVAGIVGINVAGAIA